MSRRRAQVTLISLALALAGCAEPEPGAGIQPTVPISTEVAEPVTTSRADGLTTMTSSPTSTTTLGESAEVFISETEQETEQWINLSEEGWQRLEQGGEEIDLLNFYASPDSAYAMMYPLFDSLQFDGWVDSGGDRQAIFSGGSTEALEVMQTLSLAWETIEGGEGTIEARWSLDGYFSRITIETLADGFSMSAQWTVSDVSTTVVDPPLDLPG